MAVQYTLPLTSKLDFSIEALVPHPGITEAQQWLARADLWSAPLLILSGPPASGKSHLAATRSLPLTVCDLTLQPLDRRADAQALFHLINACAGQGERLLILSRHRPAQIYPALPDLDSRLKAASHVRVREPKDEATRQAILFKLCADHQLRLDLDVATYICARLPQSLAALDRFVHLAAQGYRRPTLTKRGAKPLVEEVDRAFA